MRMSVFMILVAVLAFAQADDNGYNYESSEKSVTGSLNSGSNVDSNNSHNNPTSVVVDVQKDIFIYSAPEGEIDEIPNVDNLSNTLKKNLRVIFIRAPENKGFTEAIANLARRNAQQKTAIYVLTKQTDLSDLSNKLQNLNKQNLNKPEVHFVKYRTKEDAVNAQRIIQQQYDSLGGRTQVHNSGIAPVLDFASTKGPVQKPYIPMSNGVRAPTSDYLPIV